MSTFVLKREYALQMPTNYVEIDRDEMEYVDGGAWSTYRGNAALIELTNIIAATTTYTSVTTWLVKTCMASAATGVGVIVSVLAALGAMVSFVTAATQFAIACTAADLLKRYNGFKVNSSSVFGVPLYYGVAQI